MADIGTTLKEKIGPLPLYVWLLIMTGIALAAYVLLKKKSGPTTGTPGTPCTQTDGSAGVWDSTGTVCQAVTVSTVNQPGMDLTQQTGATATAPGTPVAPPPAPTQPGGPMVPPPANNPVPGPGPGTGNQTPAAVSGLHVTAHHTNSIGIAWSKSANATSYQVRVTYQTQVIQTHMTTGTTFTITGLSPNRTYGIHVVAINGSHWAPEASITQKTDQ